MKKVTVLGFLSLSLVLLSSSAAAQVTDCKHSVGQVQSRCPGCDYHQSTLTFWNNWFSGTMNCTNSGAQIACPEGCGAVFTASCTPCDPPLEGMQYRDLIMPAFSGDLEALASRVWIPSCEGRFVALLALPEKRSV